MIMCLTFSNQNYINGFKFLPLKMRKKIDGLLTHLFMFFWNVGKLYIGALVMDVAMFILI